MSLEDLSLTTTIHRAFAEEIACTGGSVTDVFDDARRLFVRALLPGVREVRPRDGLQAGVALRATPQEVWVHPYLFRLVCTNGAIQAHAIQTRHLRTSTLITRSEIECHVRKAVQACCREEAFAEGLKGMRSAQETQADLAINVMTMLRTHRRAIPRELIAGIIDRYFREDDQSLYGLTNAVTSIARDTPDPELRWRLEEVGGAIPAMQLASMPLDVSRVALSFVAERELVPA